MAFGPQTRLSWIAELLPFLGHADWNLKPVDNWNSPANRRFTRRPLPEVVNPALGPATAADDYPVTHYVGSAGVGEDAAGLPGDNPRAGVFGYERQLRPQDLVRGSSNTIAILGVQDQCGPWAQGGQATVRPLAHQPYINGPDGFGSGQEDGMVVGFADGSVRFLSKNTDPKIMERLVAVQGEKVDLSMFDPQPPPAAGQPLAAPPKAPAKLPVATRKRVPQPKPAAPLDRRLKAALGEPIQKISLPNMPMGDAVRLVSAVGALPVTFDPDAMQELGVSLRDPVKIEASSATVGELLDKIAAARDMARVVEHGQVVFTTTSEYREALRTATYSVIDLRRGDPRAAAELARLAQRLVAPESWKAAGGQGTVEVTPDALRITQTGCVHHQLLVFFEKLRAARGIPLTSGLDRKLFNLETRISQARAYLGHVTSINVGTATPLGEILEKLKEPAGTQIFVDRPALAAAGVSENTPTKLRCEGLPQGIALHELLEPLGLAWRVVDGNTVQITTKKAVAGRLEIEFYPLAKRLAGQPPAALIDQLKAAIPGATWGESDPQAGTPAGAIEYDPISQHLIVLQSQPVQAAVEAFLAQGAK